MSELPKIAVVVSVASFLAVSPLALHAQSECNARQILQPGNCIGDDLDALEIELAKQINDYRLRNGLPAIPLSPALSLVANRHVRDLAVMSALCHKRTHAPQQSDRSFDHFVR